MRNKTERSASSMIIVEVFGATIAYLALTATLLYPIVDAAGFLG